MKFNWLLDKHPQTVLESQYKKTITTLSCVFIVLLLSQTVAVKWKQPPTCPLCLCQTPGCEWTELSELSVLQVLTVVWAEVTGYYAEMNVPGVYMIDIKYIKIYCSGQKPLWVKQNEKYWSEVDPEVGLDCSKKIMCWRVLICSWVRHCEVNSEIIQNLCLVLSVSLTPSNNQKKYTF